MVRTWFGEFCYCSCLPVLPYPAWVLLSYILHTIFLNPVYLFTMGGGNAKPDVHKAGGVAPNQTAADRGRDGVKIKKLEIFADVL